MGIDLATYRARIGTFRGSFGVDVVTVVCFVKFSTGLKTIGAFSFIGLLLLIAGIEPNPGPERNDNVLTKLTTLVVHYKLALGVVAFAVFIRIFYREILLFGVVLLLQFLVLTLFLAVIQQKSFTEAFQHVTSELRRIILPSDNTAVTETSPKEADIFSRQIHKKTAEANTQEEKEHKTSAIFDDAVPSPKEEYMISSEALETEDEENTQEDKEDKNTATVCGKI